MTAIGGSRQKTVLITGASDGLGKEIALVLARSGHPLVLFGKNSEKLQQVSRNCKNLGASVISEAFDIRDTIKLEDSFDSALKNCGSIEVLINNAGVAYQQNLAHLDSLKISEMLDVNLKAPMILSRLFISQNNSNQKSLINISSAVTKYSHHPGRIPYSTSKLALSSFAKSLAIELEEHPIDLVNIVLGPMFTSFDRHTSPDERVRILGNAKIHRSLSNVESQPLSSDEMKLFFQNMKEWFLNPMDVALKISELIAQSSLPKFHEIELIPLRAQK